VGPGEAQTTLGLRNRQLTKRIATVDEQSGANRRRHGDALQRPLTRVGVTTVERPDPDGEDDVVRLIVGSQDKILDRGLADAHTARSDLLGGGGAGLRNG
jgi:hypothetical protein